MGRYYLHVAEVVNSKTIKLPTESDGSLLLRTLDAQFPGVSGLKFRRPNNELSGMSDVHFKNGRFLAPQEDGWGDRIYYCVWPKKAEYKKRKLDIEDEEDCRKPKKAEHKDKGRCSNLIVLSLPWKTTDVELREHFESFGEVVLAHVNQDMKTGGSKGYGFIRFATLQSQIRALAQRHNIGGRWCDVKIPESKEPQKCQKLNVCPKIHVGGLTRDITEDDLREYFSQFGEVTHVFIPKPFWPFGFVTFVNGAVAQSLIKEEHTVKGVGVLISDSDPWGNYPERNILLQKYSKEPDRKRNHRMTTMRHTASRSYRDEYKTSTRINVSRRRER